MRPIAYRAFGIGFTPVGVSASKSLSNRFEAQLDASVGLIVLSRAVPDDSAGHWNADISLRPSVKLRMGQRSKARIGLELSHISNANTRKVNPGINAVLLFAGVELRGRAAREGASK